MIILVEIASRNMIVLPSGTTLFRFLVVTVPFVHFALEVFRVFPIVFVGIW